VALAPASGAARRAPAFDTTTFAHGGSQGPVAARPDAPRRTATLVISFTDPLNGFHPMGIASSGSKYYTTNGGNAGSCVVNTFDLAGTLESSKPCTLDNRSIMWDPAASRVFTKTYDQDSYRLNPSTGQATLIGSDWFAYMQSSPAVTVAGHYLLEHEDGTIRVLRKAGGQLHRTLSGFQFGGYPSNEAVAVDDAGHILTWDGTTVYVQDWDHNVLSTISIPQGHYGFSLSFANGLLFTADDVDASGSATWYGYEIT
jgi:hypothetical protein